jgi:diguanylate cyclase
MIRARVILHTLREAGVRIALDDFGSGYSALRNLRELPIDEVKLDCGFVASLLTDRRSAAIVCAVIDLAHELGVSTVAQGVENAETRIPLARVRPRNGARIPLLRAVGASEVLELLVTEPTRL